MLIIEIVIHLHLGRDKEMSIILMKYFEPKSGEKKNDNRMVWCCPWTSIKIENNEKVIKPVSLLDRYTS